MINVNQQTLGGRVLSIETGREPLPWLRLSIRTEGVTWDRHGKRASVHTLEHVVLQGQSNVNTYSPRIQEGDYIFAIGQRLPLYAVAVESKMKGSALLATVFNLQGDVT